MNINPAQNLIAYFFKQEIEPQIIAQLDYLTEQVKVLKKQVKNLKLSNQERSKLAELGKKLKDFNRELFEQSSQIVKPKTILEWHRRHVRKKFDSSHLRKVGRPKTPKEIEELVIQIAKETQDGVAKVYGRLKTLNVDIKKSTVRTIMRNHGFPPKKTSNDYDPTWSEFLKSHRDTLLATDFFTVEVWNKWLFKTLTYYVLVFIHHGSRKMWIGGITTNPTQAWTTQIARNFVYDIEDKPKMTHLIHDADWCLRGGLEDVFKSEGIQIKRGSCRTNSMCERMNQTIKHECTNRMIFIGESSLRKALKEFQHHYNFERPHQGIDNEIPDPFSQPNFGQIQTRNRLGGLLKFYYRSAA